MGTDAKSKSWWRDLPTRFICRQGGCGSRKRIDKAERSDFAKADSLEQIEAHKASCDQLNKHFIDNLRSTLSSAIQANALTSLSLLTIPVSIFINILFSLSQTMCCSSSAAGIRLCIIPPRPSIPFAIMVSHIFLFQLELDFASLKFSCMDQTLHCPPSPHCIKVSLF